MLRDVPMTPDQLLFAAQKTVRSLGEAELEELPPIVYQALLLANKVWSRLLHPVIIQKLAKSRLQGHKDIILGGIFAQMAKRDLEITNTSEVDTLDDLVAAPNASIAIERLRPIQGTIILHIVFAVKQDQVRAHYTPIQKTQNQHLGPWKGSDQNIQVQY